MFTKFPDPNAAHARPFYGFSDILKFDVFIFVVVIVIAAREVGVSITAFEEVMRGMEEGGALETCFVRKQSRSSWKTPEKEIPKRLLGLRPIFERKIGLITRKPSSKRKISERLLGSRRISRKKAGLLAHGITLERRLLLK
jgi:hypothetical protein